MEQRGASIPTAPLVSRRRPIRANRKLVRRRDFERGVSESEEAQTCAARRAAACFAGELLTLAGRRRRCGPGLFSSVDRSAGACVDYSDAGPSKNEHQVFRIISGLFEMSAVVLQQQQHSVNEAGKAGVSVWGLLVVLVVFLCKSLPASTSEPGCVGLRMRLCLLVHGPLDRSTDLMGVAHGGCCSACCCGRRRRRCLGSICVTPRRPGASGVEGGPGGNSGARHLPACPSQTHTHTGRARGPGAQRGGNEGAIGISSRQAGFNHSSKQGPSSPPSVVYYTPPA